MARQTGRETTIIIPIRRIADIRQLGYMREDLTWGLKEGASQ